MHNEDFCGEVVGVVDTDDEDDEEEEEDEGQEEDAVAVVDDVVVVVLVFGILFVSLRPIVCKKICCLFLFIDDEEFEDNGDVEDIFEFCVENVEEDEDEMAESVSVEYLVAIGDKDKFVFVGDMLPL